MCNSKQLQALFNSNMKTTRRRRPFLSHVLRFGVIPNGVSLSTCIFLENLFFVTIIFAPCLHIFLMRLILLNYKQYENTNSTIASDRLGDYSDENNKQLK